MKINQSGELIFHRQHVVIKDNDVQDSRLSNAYDLTQTSDGGFLIAGEYFSPPSTMFPSGIQSGVVIKLDEYGCLEPDCQLVGVEEQTKHSFKLYPNPASDVVELNSGVVIDLVNIYDVRGQLLFSESVNSYSTKFNLADYSKGIYLVEVIQTNGVGLREKLVKDRGSSIPLFVPIQSKSHRKRI